MHTKNSHWNLVLPSSYGILEESCCSFEYGSRCHLSLSRWRSWLDELLSGPKCLYELSFLLETIDSLLFDSNNQPSSLLKTHPRLSLPSVEKKLEIYCCGNRISFNQSSSSLTIQGSLTSPSKDLCWINSWICWLQRWRISWGAGRTVIVVNVSVPISLAN